MLLGIFLAIPRRIRMSLPPRASLRTQSQSGPPLPKSEGNYSDRFKNRSTASVVAPVAAPIADATSFTDFPVLKGPIVAPNLVVMPSTRPAISFAAKVKEMVATETAAKERAAAEALLKAEEAKKDAFHQGLYASIFTRERREPVPQTDSWDQEDYGGTPEFGREEFLRFEDGQEDYENHEEENN